MMRPNGLARSDELAQGQIVGGYKLRQLVGAGPTGTVYAAIHPQSGQKVAVKLVYPYLSRPGPALDEFLACARELTSFNHPDVLRLLSAGTISDGSLYVISEFARGESLNDFMAASGALMIDEAGPLLCKLAATLAAAHERALVHGGLTPENVRLVPRDDGRWPPAVKVMDFGLALLRRPGLLLDEERDPYYLAPEQCRGELPGPLSDGYAFGAVAFRLLTGRLPFSAPRPREVLRLHLEEAPPRPSQIVPMAGALEALLLRALAKEPAARFPSMRHLLAEGLEPLLAAAAERPESWPLAGAAAGEATAAAAGGETGLPQHATLAQAAGESDLSQGGGPSQGSGDGAAPPQVAKPFPGYASLEVRPGRTKGFGLAGAGDSLLPHEECPAEPEAAHEVTTDVLPKLDGRSRTRRLAGAWLSALLGLGTALCAGVVAYRLLTGHWPW